MIREEVRKAQSGYIMIVALLVAQGVAIYAMVSAISAQSIWGTVGAVLANLFFAVLWAGLFMVNPNEAKVLQLFGKYVGTVREPGRRWANPLYWQTKVSTRVRNFETGKLEERKAAMISNLLVVLCSEDSTQPVVNTGSLYT